MDRTAEVFAAIESRSRGLQRLAIVVGVVLALSLGALALEISVIVQALAFDGYFYTGVTAISACGGAMAGVVGTRALHKALFRRRIAVWREDLKRTLGASDTDIDEAVAMLR